MASQQKTWTKWHSSITPKCYGIMCCINSYHAALTNPDRILKKIILRQKVVKSTNKKEYFNFKQWNSTRKSCIGLILGSKKNAWYQSLDKNTTILPDSLIWPINLIFDVNL